MSNPLFILYCIPSENIVAEYGARRSATSFYAANIRQARAMGVMRFVTEYPEANDEDFEFVVYEDQAGLPRPQADTWDEEILYQYEWDEENQRPGKSIKVKEPTTVEFEKLSKDKRLSERKKHWDRQSFVLKKYLLECLQTSGRTTFKTTLNTFTARKGGVSLVIDNMDLLPDEFVESHTEVVTKPINDTLKKALQDIAAKVEALKAAGEEPKQELLNAIPGAHLETGSPTLQVR